MVARTGLPFSKRELNYQVGHRISHAIESRNNRFHMGVMTHQFVKRIKILAYGLHGFIQTTSQVKPPVPIFKHDQKIPSFAFCSRQALSLINHLAASATVSMKRLTYLRA